MGDKSSDENPFAPPAEVESASVVAETKSISWPMYFYQYVAACCAFFLIVMISYILLTVLLPPDLWDSAVAIPIQTGVYLPAFYLARWHLRSSLANLTSKTSTDD